MAAARAAWPTETTDGIGGIAPERLVFLDKVAQCAHTADPCNKAPPSAWSSWTSAAC